MRKQFNRFMTKRAVSRFVEDVRAMLDEGLTHDQIICETAKKYCGNKYLPAKYRGDMVRECVAVWKAENHVIAAHQGRRAV